MRHQKTRSLISASVCIASVILLFVTIHPSHAWAWEVVYSSATDFYHQIGRPDADGWSASTGQDSPNQYLCYGPYTTLIPAGAATASFRLMLDNNTVDNLPVVSLDVYDNTNGQILTQRTVQRQEFSDTFSYQNFDLSFTSVGGHQLEFRTWWFGVSYIRQINVRISGQDVSFPPGYQGCFTDDPNRALPTLFGTGHSVDSCKQTVKNAGLAYAGLQNRGECWGGHLRRYNRVSDAECNAPCDANPSQICGGTWRNSIYVTGINAEIDYFGKDLFLGIAYHRWGCVVDGPYLDSRVTTNNTYQGFDFDQQCHAGWTWQQQRNSADIFIAFVSSGNLRDESLGDYFCNANWDYGLKLNEPSDPRDYRNYCHSWQTGFANNDTFGVNRRAAGGEPNACDYNVIFDCNSDCWIRDFSRRQGTTIDIASPCL